MALLDKNEYGSILFAANKFPEIQDITDHFLSEYRTNIPDNPRFIEKLNELIQSVKSKLEQLVTKHTDNYKSNIYPDGSPREIKDYKNYKFPTRDLGFGLTVFTGGDRMSLNKINDVEKAFNQFEINVLILEGKEKDTTKKIKLNWKGSKIQLYSVLRQLKNDYEMIGNSYNELADFLILNVISFEKTKKETVEKELKKKQQPPKNKRVSINLND